MDSPIAFWNGQLVPEAEARLPFWDLGVVAGAAVSEMIRTFQHAPFRLGPHLDRLEQSLKTVGFPTAFDRDQVTNAVHEVVTVNTRLIPASHDLGIVIFVTAGRNLTYLGARARAESGQGTVCVHTFPLPFELWVDKLEQGLRLQIPRILQPDSIMLPTHVKYRSRLHWYLADQEARSHDPQASALLLDRDGYLTETSAGNIFLVTDGQISTPRPQQALGGISQQVVKELAKQLRIPYNELDLRPADCDTASEAFLSSTPVCLLPISTLSGKSIGPAAGGPVFQRLISAWNELVGLDIIQQIRDGARDRMAS